MKQIIKSIVVALILLQSVCFLNAQQTFLTAIPSESSLASSIKGDDKIQVASATNTGGIYSALNEGPISYSYDGNYNSWYHSNANQLPITIDYNFDGNAIDQMDYLIYHPRPAGSNGNFQQLEIWYATQANSTLTKLGDFNFQGTSVPKSINFSPALVRPTKVRFIVRSGVGGFASCAEMEFYRKNPDSFNYSSIFTDETCSALKPETTLDDINAISDRFYKKLASDIYHGFFDSEFRVQEYRAWEHPDKKITQNKTEAYSLQDNPTGIYVSADDDLIVFAGDISQGQSISLLVHDLSTGDRGTVKNYSLKQGLNKIRMTSKGLIYVQYYNDLGVAAPKVKINFVNGLVNGYFDKQKHTAADWNRLLNKAVGPDFDVLDEFVHLTFPVANFKKLTDGPAFISTWNQMVIWEHEFMGLYKYPDHKFQNRMYCSANYNASAPWMYATRYYTAYSPGSWNGIIKQDWHNRDEVWGPAHEVGHVNQVRPGVKWLGMTEVTTNIYSLHVQTSFGNTSRLAGSYTAAFAKAATGVAHMKLGDLFYQLVPFWQLKLYLIDVLGKTDFYKDLFHYYMTTPDPTTPATDGRHQLNFVRVACNIAELDLTDFFEKWGFLTPIDETFNDYGSARFTVTQAQIDALKTEIAAKNYPQPPRDFSRITDNNKDTYR